MFVLHTYASITCKPNKNVAFMNIRTADLYPQSLTHPLYILGALKLSHEWKNE